MTKTGLETKVVESDEPCLMDDIMAAALKAREEETSKQKKETKTTSSTSSGFSKGFLSSSSTKKKKRKKKKKGSKKDSNIERLDVPTRTEEDSSETSSLVLEEVQDAMKSSPLSSLQEGEWMTPDFMTKVSRNDKLKEGLGDPTFMQAMSLLSTNPDEGMQMLQVFDLQRIILISFISLSSDLK